MAMDEVKAEDKKQSSEEATIKVEKLQQEVSEAHKWLRRQF